MKVVLVAGGTGGHVFPAIALGEYLRDMEQASILFVGVKDKMEANEVPKHGLEFVGLEAKGFVGGLSNRMKCLQLVASNYNLAKKMLRDFKPDIVIGFGGYICVPLLLAAKHLHIPVMIHEQNSVAGLANKVLGKSADGIVTCFSHAESAFPKERTRLLGSPRASSICKKEKDYGIYQTLKLEGKKPLVYIVMGSLGSETVNASMQSVIEYFIHHDEIELVYVTGPKHYEEMLSKLPKLPSYIHVVPFVDQEKLLPFVDVMVCRAGATTLAELCALGVPSILIPSPYVAHNHQFLNASELLESGACEMIEEKNLTCETVIGKILALCKSREQREMLASKAKQHGRVDASEKITAFIHELID